MGKEFSSIAKLIGSIVLAYAASITITTMGLSVGAWARSISPSLSQAIMDIPGLSIQVAAVCAPFALPIIAVLELVKLRSPWVYGLCGAAVPLVVIAVLLPHNLFSTFSWQAFWTALPDYALFIGTGFVSGAVYRLVRRYTFDIKPARTAISAPSDATA